MSATNLHRRPTSSHHSPSPSSTTSLYHTHFGIFVLTWSRSLLRRSLHLHLLRTTTAATPSFHLQIKPLLFWTKTGSKKIPLPGTKNQFLRIQYDLSRAKFGSGPEPQSGFYIAATISGETALLVGDSPKRATFESPPQIAVLRREHVHGISTKKYTTRAPFRGKTREITVDCTRVTGGDDSRLSFSVNGKKALVVKHLNWKFRGHERVETDGVQIQISWNVHDLLFESGSDDGHALFMFRFEKSGFDYHEDDKYLTQLNSPGSDIFGSALGFEERGVKKGMLRTAARSSSSSSLSSASSGCGSVMEWESVEENELKSPSGFSLLVYAWKG